MQKFAACISIALSEPSLPLALSPNECVCMRIFGGHSLGLSHSHERANVIPWCRSSLIIFAASFIEHLLATEIDPALNHFLNTSDSSSPAGKAIPLVKMLRRLAKGLRSLSHRINRKSSTEQPTTELTQEHRYSVLPPLLSSL